MALVNKNIPMVHRREWQIMTNAIGNSTAGAFIVADENDGVNDQVLFIHSSTLHALYNHSTDSFVTVQSGALGGTFGAGSCGCFVRWSAPFTCSGGTTLTATTTAAISSLMVNCKVRFTTGANVGLERTVLSVLVNHGGSSIITLDSALPNAVANSDQFICSSGRFFVLNAGTFATNSIRFLDVATCTWGSSLSFTGLPATWGTEAKCITQSGFDVYAQGTATSGAAATLTCTGKTWPVNRWANYQVRIVAGSGIGQVRTISSNTADTLTVSPAWTTQPTATSQFVVEGNDDFIYLTGNNAVTMYRYSISSNSWTTLAPTAARLGPMATGGGLTLIGRSKTLASWNDETTGSAGRYLYSMRGGGSVVMDRYDIAANTWYQIPAVNPNGETFNTGSSFCSDGRYMYCRRENHRFFRYNVSGNEMEAFSTLPQIDNAGISGTKTWVKHYTEGEQIKASWLYSWVNSGIQVFRTLIY